MSGNSNLHAVDDTNTLGDAAKVKWIPLKTNPLGYVNVASEFKPSQYDADLTMDATGEVRLLASGVSLGSGRVWIYSHGVTTEDTRIAFGTSEANALANLTIVTNAATTGVYLPSNVDVAGAGIIILAVPSLATHVAAGPATAGDTHTVTIIQGI